MAIHLIIDVKKEIELELEVCCPKCGKNLHNNTHCSVKGDKILIEVEPCETCLKHERDAGYDEGVSDK